MRLREDRQQNDTCMDEEHESRGIKGDEGLPVYVSVRECAVCACFCTRKVSNKRDKSEKDWVMREQEKREKEKRHKREKEKVGGCKATERREGPPGEEQSKTEHAQVQRLLKEEKEKDYYRDEVLLTLSKSIARLCMISPLRSLALSDDEWAAKKRTSTRKKKNLPSNPSNFACVLRPCA